MNQNIWGSHMWFSLHTITFMYPIQPTPKEKEEYKIYFESLQNVIPCSVCKKNYIRHLREHPISNSLVNRRKLVEWLIDMHNMVNGEIGKKILSYNTVIKKYEKVYGKKIKLDEEYTKEELYGEIVNESFSNSSPDSDSSFTRPVLLCLAFLLILICMYCLYCLYFASKQKNSRK